MNNKKYPLININRIYATTVDEWYGVQCEFRWENQSDLIDDYDQKLVQHVAYLVVNSQEYEEFYKSEHVITCEEYEDGPEVEVKLPRFRASDFTDWGFDQEGGWISASTR